ncbi:MAG: YbaK/EbsC family protein [Myxococcota bacterium]
MAIEARIVALLHAAGAEFTTLEHRAVRDATDAAQARGTPLSMGGKALVMKVGTAFAVFALPADRTVDNRALRTHLHVRRYRFATADELSALTGLTPGAVPPFGRPVVDLPLYVDTTLASTSTVAFTPGVHTRSLVVPTADWLRAARPTDVFAFASR